MVTFSTSPVIMSLATGTGTGTTSLVSSTPTFTGASSGGLRIRNGFIAGAIALLVLVW